jgi:tRNA pseudouridine55 synthase
LAKSNKRLVSGWLLLDKPYGMTSTQAVGKVRWLYGAEKAGHAGTLDPLATGMLPIALGEATKTVPFVQEGGKLYRFDLEWGSETSTDDAEGDVTATSDVRPGETDVAAMLPRFTGTIMQRPPAFSAIKVNGERAYDLARAGETVELAERPVTITALTLLKHGTERSSFEMACEKGTYVRSLARDLAQALGTRGHVTALRRPEDAALLRNGNPVLLRGAGAPVELPAAWASLNGAVLAIGQVRAGHFHPSRVLRG